MSDKCAICSGPFQFKIFDRECELLRGATPACSVCAHKWWKCPTGTSLKEFIDSCRNLSSSKMSLQVWDDDKRPPIEKYKHAFDEIRRLVK